LSAWQSYYNRFKQYLRLERSLSGNSIEAYQYDLQKLENYSQLFCNHITPDRFTGKQLQEFSAWIAGLGFSAATQGRIVSGAQDLL
jgi:integrase/recombinase XerD